MNESVSVPIRTRILPVDYVSLPQFSIGIDSTAVTMSSSKAPPTNQSPRPNRREPSSLWKSYDARSARRPSAVDMKAFGKINILINNSAMQEVCEDLGDIDLDVVDKAF